MRPFAALLAVCVLAGAEAPRAAVDDEARPLPACSPPAGQAAWTVASSCELAGGLVAFDQIVVAAVRQMELRAGTALMITRRTQRSWRGSVSWSCASTIHRLRQHLARRYRVLGGTTRRCVTSTTLIRVRTATMTNREDARQDHQARRHRLLGRRHRRPRHQDQRRRCRQATGATPPAIIWEH